MPTLLEIVQAVFQDEKKWLKRKDLVLAKPLMWHEIVHLTIVPEERHSNSSLCCRPLHKYHRLFCPRLWVRIAFDKNALSVGRRGFFQVCRIALSVAFGRTKNLYKREATHANISIKGVNSILSKSVQTIRLSTGYFIRSRASTQKWNRIARRDCTFAEHVIDRYRDARISQKKKKNIFIRLHRQKNFVKNIKYNSAHSKKS